MAEGTTWNVKEHASIIPCTTSGYIDFGDQIARPFARISVDTSFEKTIELLRGVWGVPLPRVVVSIIGGAKGFVLPYRINQALTSTIETIASTKNTWIITGGMDAGGSGPFLFECMSG